MFRNGGQKVRCVGRANTHVLKFHLIKPAPHYSLRHNDLDEKCLLLPGFQCRRVIFFSFAFARRPAFSFPFISLASFHILHFNIFIMSGKFVFFYISYSLHVSTYLCITVFSFSFCVLIYRFHLISCVLFSNAVNANAFHVQFCFLVYFCFLFCPFLVIFFFSFAFLLFKFFHAMFTKTHTCTCVEELFLILPLFFFSLHP